ncbi:hypothetical protein HC931_28090, partial [Candidatus Gracilibacteria bacterium]|nr:hypothetical protein [Candidatus Gracilibacteria bacterium]
MKSHSRITSFNLLASFLGATSISLMLGLPSVAQMPSESGTTTSGETTETPTMETPATETPTMETPAAGTETETPAAGTEPKPLLRELKPN